MRDGPEALKSAAGGYLSFQDVMPGLVPPGPGRAKGFEVEGGILNDITLKPNLDGQPRWPAPEDRPQGQMQCIEFEAIAIFLALRHRESTRFATMIMMTVPVLVFVLVLVLVLVFVFVLVLVFVFVLVFVPPPWHSRCPPQPRDALLNPRAKLLFFYVHIDFEVIMKLLSHPQGHRRLSHQSVESLEEVGELIVDLATDDEQIGVDRSLDQIPAPLASQPLCFEALLYPPDCLDEKEPGTGEGEAAKPGDQVHLKAPSLQA